MLASLVSETAGQLRFRAIYYLHDTGPAVFTVLASTPGRSTQWDDREAVLFLARSEDGGAEFKFADTTRWNYLPDGGHIARKYTGPLPAGYTIGTRNPVWLPAVSRDGARGSFILEADEPLGPTVATFAEIRSKIAWVYGGEGIEGYDYCLRSSLVNIRSTRDSEAYHGEPWVLTSSERIASGRDAGVVLYEHGSYSRNQAYPRVWLTGRDAILFRAQIVDDDDDPANGFTHTITTGQPLPDGRYRFLEHEQSGGEMPCNYIRPGFEWVVTVGGALPTLAPEPTPDRSR